MKVALCLHGLVGSIKGKNGDLKGGSDKVLELSYKHNLENILGQNVDVFIHSWSTELENEIVNLYKPKKYLIEPQIEFEIPSFIKANHRRAFAHLSRWYSYSEAVKLKADYEKVNDFKYDLVLVQRFDLCWNVAIPYIELDTEVLYVGGCSLDTRKEWSDRWFISNSKNMDKFATMFDKFEDYMGAKGGLPSSKQHGGISSHFLVKYHASRLGLKEKFKYNFGGFGDKPDDYNEVRRLYYGDR